MEEGWGLRAWFVRWPGRVINGGGKRIHVSGKRWADALQKVVDISSREESLSRCLEDV